MPKSKYPNKLDTSIEIPAVRDNIVDVGSDVLNSIRSASIFLVGANLPVWAINVSAKAAASETSYKLQKFT